MWFIALAWAATSAADATGTSLVLAAGSVPRAALLLFGGSVADRLGPLRVVLGSGVARIALMTALTGVALGVTAVPLPVLLVGALLFGVVDAVRMPALGSLPPMLLPAASLPAAQGAVQTAIRLVDVAVAPLGGLLVAAHGLGLATGVEVVLFTAALVLLRGLRPHVHAVPAGPAAAPTVGVWRDTVAGLRYARDHPTLRVVLPVVAAANLVLAAPLNVGVALSAEANGWGSTGFGLVIAGFGGGATLGAVLVMRQRPRRSLFRAGLLWAAASGVPVVGLGLVASLPLAVVLAAALGLTAAPSSAMLLGLVQSSTEPRYLGRVMAMVTFTAVGLIPLSYSAFGVLVGATSVPVAFVSCGVAALVVIAVAGLLSANRA